ncbi:MAG: HPr family phosphocarrier protein [Clostridia bacterium]|nr:HPr family phosphocarrier protein [Clostridia bacterium]
MKEFTYTIADPLGMHARPAGLLARTAMGWPDTAITVEKAGDVAKATQLLRLMSMGIRRGDEIRVRAEGPQEEAAIAAMEAFFREHL